MAQERITFTHLRYLVASDIYRYHGHYSLALFLWECVWGIGCRVTIWMRLAGYLKGKGPLFFPLYAIARLLHRHYTFRFGIDIPCTTRIGPGLYIGHFGAIVVSGRSTIGRNCNLSQGVTVGAVFRGPRAGAPVIGDNVYLGPGCKIVGKVTIGNNAAVGANCVVTRDVSDNAVVVGIPGRCISENGSEGYILNSDYDDLLLAKAPSDSPLNREERPPRP